MGQRCTISVSVMTLKTRGGECSTMHPCCTSFLTLILVTLNRENSAQACRHNFCIFSTSYTACIESVDMSKPTLKATTVCEPAAERCSQLFVCQNRRPTHKIDLAPRKCIGLQHKQAIVKSAKKIRKKIKSFYFYTSGLQRHKRLLHF